MYKLSKAAAGRIQDVAGFTSVIETFPNAGAANRLVRFMNAAHVVGYVGLGGPYKKKNFLIEKIGCKSLNFLMLD